MPIPTLFDMAKQKIIANIEMLNDVGDLPYSFLRPILLRVANPDQLREIEKASPQIAGEDGEIWLKFIERDIPNWDKKPHRPREPNSPNWWKVYRKLKREAEEEKAKQEEQLKERMRALQADRSKNKTQIVTAPPGVNYAAKRRAGGGGSGWGNRDAPPKNPKTGMDKLRRAIYDGTQARPRGSQIPAHKLQERKSILREAPKTFVRPSTMSVPRRGTYTPSTSVMTAPTADPMRAREDRLRAFTAPNAASSGSDGTNPPGRVSLPTDRTFSAPKVTGTSEHRETPPKRKKEANMFMPNKKRG